jgi:DNA invertase Pin-like site-specific DNA recombinase
LTTVEVSDKSAVVYLRVSTGKQAAEGVSLDAQRARAEGWCLARRVRLGDVYRDEGVRGKRADNRPGLQAALDAVCACRGVLVCYSLSRVARSVRDAHAIADRLKKHGADLVSLTENLDTTTPTGRLMFGLLAVLAEFERDLVSERTLGAMAHKRAKGERLGQIPYGKRLAADGATLEGEPADVALAVELRALRRQGLGLRALAKVLNGRGVVAKNGKPFSAWSVRRLIGGIDDDAE